jgi:hypothetical protein
LINLRCNNNPCNQNSLFITIKCIFALFFYSKGNSQLTNPLRVHPSRAHHLLHNRISTKNESATMM